MKKMKKMKQVLLLIIALVSTFSCQKEDAVAEQVVHIKFYNKTNYDLTELKLYDALSIGDLKSNASTDFLDFQSWSTSYPNITSKEISGNYLRCGNESHQEILSGHLKIDILSSDDGTGIKPKNFLMLVPHYE
jgi:hypothetical protein